MCTRVPSPFEIARVTKVKGLDKGGHSKVWSLVIHGRRAKGKSESICPKSLKDLSEVAAHQSRILVRILAS